MKTNTNHNLNKFVSEVKERNVLAILHFGRHNTERSGISENKGKSNGSICDSQVHKQGLGFCWDTLNIPNNKHVITNLGVLLKVDD